MATTYQSSEVSTGIINKSLHVDARVVTLEAAVLVIDDIIEMVPVFAGETVLSVQLTTDDLDTNGAPAITLDVGDGDDDDRYIVASTVAQAGGRAEDTVGCPYSYSADDTIDVHVDTAPATGAAGTVTMVAMVSH